MRKLLLGLILFAPFFSNAQVRDSWLFKNIQEAARTHRRTVPANLAEIEVTLAGLNQQYLESLTNDEIKLIVSLAEQYQSRTPLVSLRLFVNRLYLDGTFEQRRFLNGLFTSILSTVENHELVKTLCYETWLAYQSRSRSGRAPASAEPAQFTERMFELAIVELQGDLPARAKTVLTAALFIEAALAHSPSNGYLLGALTTFFERAPRANVDVMARTLIQNMNYFSGGENSRQLHPLFTPDLFQTFIDRSIGSRGSISDYAALDLLGEILKASPATYASLPDELRRQIQAITTDNPRFEANCRAAIAATKFKT